MRKIFNPDFYPQSCIEIKNYIDYFSEILDKNIDEENKKRLFKINPKMLIVPHASWIYSGFTANFAFKMCENLENKRVIIIAPSHKLSFKDASICLENSFETPCNNLTIDTDFSLNLKEKFNLNYISEVHQEHSTEVQIPFIANYIKNPKIVEIIYSEIENKKLSKIIDYLLNDKDNLIVISSDLSHYHSKKEALMIDYNCIQAVYDLDISKMKNCEACGKIGIEATILSAIKNNLTSLIVDYRTSADINNNEKEVVGYMSAILI